jgi:hypothetical protein
MLTAGFCWIMSIDVGVLSKTLELEFLSGIFTIQRWLLL